MRRLLLVPLLAAACAPRLDGSATRSETFEVEGARFQLVYGPGDAEAAAEVAAAVRGGMASIQRFARLRRPVTITIQPGHEALEAVARTEGLDWLRAWARYASVDLQSPRTWPDGPDARRLRDLVVHELTHCAMYQTAGSEWFWSLKGIPTWFSEGMAMVAAGEARRRAGLGDLLAFYREADRAARRLPGAPVPGADPLSAPGPLLARDDDLVYGAARLSFQFLLDRYGEERVREVLRRMGAGHQFDASFRDGIGIDPEAFLADFRRYLLWRGWER